eukprot:gb/GECG01015026.1/.p1 GENE.gb/GECG01015026.1/~~gb/GECG01015026.1/.p1  ORF type:complete len:436 (+),score=49.89 gb/GECG01015026.1/:1-1308(+)
MASSDATKRQEEMEEEEDTRAGKAPPLARNLEGAGVPPGYSQLHWMKLVQSNDNLSGLPAAERGKVIPLSEVAKHRTYDDAWTVLKGQVYNITPFLPYHPGGKGELMRAAGRDATELFYEVHGWVNFETLLSSCYIGTLSSNDADVWSATGIADDASDASSERSDSETSPSSLLGGHKEWQCVTCASKKTISEDGKCFLLRFDLERNQRLGLSSAGKHILVRAPGGKVVAREYTPVSPLREKGYFELAIKTYDESDGMSKCIRNIQVGEHLEVSGPYGDLKLRRNAVKFGTQVYTPSHICLVGGGSGVTPLLQILEFLQSGSSTRDIPVYVLCIHRSRESAMLLDHFEQVAKSDARFRISCAFTQGSSPPSFNTEESPVTYMSSTGHLTADFLTSMWPEPSSKIFAGICGTIDFCRHFDDVLRDMYYPADNIFIF